MRYVLGVDGGNTKTDYLLHTLDGKLARHIRAGTCSHEAVGMDGAHREMEARIRALLDGVGCSLADVAAAAFGLAGVDQPVQQDALYKIVRTIGFSRSIVMNDSFLGIKAGSETGVGVSSINGTGTSAGGIDGDGTWMQVGGIGAFSGDEAGGSYLAARTLRAAYDSVYRFGEETSLLGRVLALLSCDDPSDLHTRISTQYAYGTAVTATQVIAALFAAYDEGDAVAAGIVRHVADALARSAAGCTARLRFGDTVPVVLIGSVWTKGRFQPMIDHFRARYERYAAKQADLRILEVPPAAGSVLWALELALGRVPGAALREVVFADTKGL